MKASISSAAPAVARLSTTTANGRVAYVLKGFPRLSESFIANEIRRLSALDLPMTLYSIKHGDDLANHNGLPPVHYLPTVASTSNTTLARWLRHNAGPYRSALAFWLRRAPIRTLSTALFALGCARRYRDTGLIRKSFIKQFLFAVHIAERVVKTRDVTLIHAHFCHDATMIAWLASRLTRLPFSFTAHAKDIYQQKQNPRDLLHRKVSAARFVATCTKNNVDHLKSLVPDAADRIHGIYHGVDINNFRPPTGTPAQSPFRILSVGRHVEKKGFRYLLQACAILSNRGIRFHLDIIGEDGNETQAMRATLKQLGLCDLVTLHPPVAQHQLIGWYHRANVFVMSSVVVADGDRDGIPNVMAEAMACAVPVVVSAVSGIPELVTHGVNGLVVPPRDADALADAIAQLGDDPKLRDRLGAQARETVVHHFNAAKTHRLLNTVFRRALANETFA